MSEGKAPPNRRSALCGPQGTPAIVEGRYMGGRNVQNLRIAMCKESMWEPDGEGGRGGGLCHRGYVHGDSTVGKSVA